MTIMYHYTLTISGFVFFFIAIIAPQHQKKWPTWFEQRVDIYRDLFEMINDL